MNQRRLADTLLRSLSQRGQSDVCGTDQDLLRRYVENQDVRALETLVRRHGPLVHGVCRRLLPRSQDIEDAVQSSFVVLARRAGNVRGDGSLPNWLFSVAWREALRIRRRRRTQPLAEDQAAREQSVPEVLRAIDEEVARLPADCRASILLCYFAGRTQDQAARQLGCSLRTLQYRLERGRKMLADRLRRGGHALSLGALTALLCGRAASAGVPRALLGAAVRVAVQQAGQPAGLCGGLAAIPAGLGALGVPHYRLWAATVLLAVMLSGVGGWILGPPASSIFLSSARREGVSDTLKHSVQLYAGQTEERAPSAAIGRATAWGTTWIYDLDLGKVVINGTPKDDYIVLRNIGGKLAFVDLSLKVTNTGVALGSNLDIEVNGLGGDDQLLGYSILTFTKGAGSNLVGANFKTLTLNGGDGNDTLVAAQSGKTILNGGAGNDTLIDMGNASAVMNGDAGNNEFYLNGPSQAYGGAGDNTFYVIAPNKNQRIAPNLTLRGGPGKNKFIFVTDGRPFTLSEFRALKNIDFNPLKDQFAGSASVPNDLSPWPGASP